MNDPVISPLWLAAAIVGGFAIVFPLMWCGIVWSLSRFGGWNALARHYAAGDRPVRGRVFNSVNGMVGATSYRFVLTLHVDEEGLFLEPMVLFRVGHPRLFVPWRDVSARSRVSLLWWQAERLTVGVPKIATITLPVGIVPGHLPCDASPNAG